MLLREAIVIGSVVGLAACGFYDSMMGRSDPIDYTGLIEKTHRVSSAVTRSSDRLARTFEIAHAVQTVRDDYVAFRDLVRPHLIDLPLDVREKAIEVDGYLIEMHLIASSIVERQVGADIFIDVVEATRLLTPTREGINTLIDMGNQYREQFEPEIVNQFDVVVGKWHSIDSLLRELEAATDKSMKIDKLKRGIRIIAELVPIFKSLAEGLKSEA